MRYETMRKTELTFNGMNFYGKRKITTPSKFM